MISLLLRIAVVALLASAASALAANEPKPVVAISTKAIEAKIVIDPALKVYPALYGRLLATAKRAYDDARKEAQRELKESPDMFTDGRKHYYARSYLVRSAIGPYISILDREETFTGGAHPNHGVDTLLWDTQTGRMMNIKPFFNEMADNGPALQMLAQAIRVALLVEKKSRDIEIADPARNEWMLNVKPEITSIGGIALSPSTEKGKSSGLIAYFSPYAVGPYAEGEYSVFIPFKEFQSALSPKGASLFGGSRPTGDDKND